MPTENSVFFLPYYFLVFFSNLFSLFYVSSHPCLVTCAIVSHLSPSIQSCESTFDSVGCLIASAAEPPVSLQTLVQNYFRTLVFLATPLQPSSISFRYRVQVVRYLLPINRRMRVGFHRVQFPLPSFFMPFYCFSSPRPLQPLILLMNALLTICIRSDSRFSRRTNEMMSSNEHFVYQI